MSDTKSLGELYPLEQARCRELLEAYKAIGPAGQFAHYMISETLKRADAAAISGDLTAMIRCYEQMKLCE